MSFGYGFLSCFCSLEVYVGVDIMWSVFVFDREEDSHCLVVFVCVLRDRKNSSAGDVDAHCPSIGESNSKNS